MDFMLSLFLYRTYLIFEWHMATIVINNRHQKHFYYEIGLCAQKISWLEEEVS
jgi:hypothetical protein